MCAFFFFFNDTATTEIYTLSLHDALPISRQRNDSFALCATTSRMPVGSPTMQLAGLMPCCTRSATRRRTPRSEEHTSELQSQSNLVCRLLLEKKKTPDLRT